MSHLNENRLKFTYLSVPVEGGEFVLVDVSVDVADGGPGRRAERPVDVAHQPVDRLFQILQENVRGECDHLN